MITATIESNLYEIEFQHTGKDTPKHVRHTLCTVSVFAPTNNVTCPRHGPVDVAPKESECHCIPVVTATAAARCNPIDGFKRETGRKIALDRALREVEPVKAFRKVCWDAYHNRANSQVSKRAA